MARCPVKPLPGRPIDSRVDAFDNREMKIPLTTSLLVFRAAFFLNLLALIVAGPAEALDQLGPTPVPGPPPSISQSALSIRKNAPVSEQPFWRRRSELMQKIKEDREVIVSVRHQSVDRPGGQLEQFTMNGAGLVARPKDFCFAVSQQYDKLKEISEHFKTVNYSASSHQLFLVTEALGYQARMILLMQPVSEDWRSELQWEVIWGHFKGMKGLIGYERVDDGHTEMSLHADYEAKELPLPKILMGFALEVITKKVAEKMRTFIEEQPALAAESVAPNPSPSPKTDVTSLQLPPGFKISVFADDVPNARQMALSPKGTLFVGSKEEGNVYAVPVKDGVAGPAVKVATGLKQPSGVAFIKGSLYVSEISRIIRFDQIEAKLARPPKPVVVRGDFPKEDWHGWKSLHLGPDGWLYTAVGAPCNLCVVDDRIYASITRTSLDGKKREIYAEGVRNSLGMDWDPKTHQLWFTDNGADQMGDDRPTDELNHAAKSGLNFGYPYCHQGDILDPKFGTGKTCGPAGPFTPPALKLDPHGAALGMIFYTGKMFPAEYQGRIFIAEHGSWNRTKKIGYRVLSVPVAGDKAGPFTAFAEGWLQGESAWGRPNDILQMPDGSLLVSDDLKGAIYRISYEKPAAPQMPKPGAKPDDKTNVN